jgi:hypothetical protein
VCLLRCTVVHWLCWGIVHLVHPHLPQLLHKRACARGGAVNCCPPGTLAQAGPLWQLHCASWLIAALPVYAQAGQERCSHTH